MITKGLLVVAVVLAIAAPADAGHSTRFYSPNVTRSLVRLNAHLNPTYAQNGWLALGCLPFGGDQHANMNAYGRSHGFPKIVCTWYFGGSATKVAARVTFTTAGPKVVMVINGGGVTRSRTVVQSNLWGLFTIH